MRAGLLLLGSAAALAACTAGKPPASSVPPEVARGQAYYTTCQGCHGNAGEGFAGMNAPRLAGLPAAYVAEQLILYRKGLRGGPEDFLGVQMNGRAKALPDEQAVRDVAAYIAPLPAPPQQPATSPANPAGADLFVSCVACHGDKAQGNAALGAPPLAGTDAAYLARQLRNYKAGIRGREGDTLGQQMRAAAAVLPDDAAIDAVAAHAAALK